MAINYLSIIARYELKVLFRNKVFILFACLSIGGIPLLQYFFQEQFSLYYLKALACSFPFVNAFLFNLLQSLAVVFVGGDFVKRDWRCDSLEAIRPRPYCNSEYITGKYIAVVFGFLVLNIFTAFPVLVLHRCVSSSPFHFWYYLFYLFTLTLPALIFITALTMLVYVLVRIPHFALLVLIGYLGLNYFCFTEWGHGCMDFLAIPLPNLFSETTGHVGLDLYLWQRLAVVLVGLAMLLFTISVIKRNDNRSCISLYIKAMAVILGIGGLIAGGYYYGTFQENKQKREQYRELYKVYQRKERVSVLKQQITYRQAGDWIEVVDTLVLKNTGQHALEEVILYLNPGLQVTNIESYRGNALFCQQEQVIVVQQGLKADSVCQVVIRYNGIIDENICYLDIQDEIYEQTAWSNNLLRYGKRNAMVSDSYTFLTPECLWYPMATPPVNSVTPWLSDFDFTHFQLFVIHDSVKTVISQGQMQVNKRGTCFVNSQPLPGISLCAGPYQRVVYNIDSVDFEIYALKSGNKFRALLDGMPEGIQQGMKALFEEMEFKYGERYPYRKLALVELPLAFSTYLRDWKTGSEFVQPELLFQLENWCKNTYCQPMHDYIKVLKDFGIQQSDTSMVSDYILNFFSNQFGENYDEFSRFTWVDLFRKHPIVLETVKNQVPLTPMFTDFIRKIHAEAYPGIDKLIYPLCLNHQTWLKLFRGEVGVSEEYGAMRYLTTGSLKQALMDPQAFPDMEFMFRLKSLFLEKYLSACIGIQELQCFLRERFAGTIFQNVSIEEFIIAFKQKFGLDLTDVIRQLYEQQGLPVLQIQHIKQYMAKEGRGVFITFEVWNPTKLTGVLTCYTKSREEVADFQEVKSVIIPGEDCCRVTISLESSVQDILLHTNLSGNLPLGYEAHFGVELPEIAGLQEGVVPLDKKRFFVPENEIIVDNEDEGFRIQEPSRGRKIFSKPKDPKLSEFGNGVNFLTQNFSGWLKSVYSFAYGNTNRSFYGKVTGQGESKAVWKVDIPEEGVYELYAYQLGLQNRYQTYDLARYYYTLEQIDYKADITVGIDKTGKRTVQIKDNTGDTDEFEFYMEYIQGSDWVPLGTYDLKEGECKLFLNDQGAFAGQLIFADAIKWIRIEK